MKISSLVTFVTVILCVGYQANKADAGTETAENPRWWGLHYTYYSGSQIPSRQNGAITLSSDGEIGSIPDRGLFTMPCVAELSDDQIEIMGALVLEVLTKYAGSMGEAVPFHRDIVVSHSPTAYLSVSGVRPEVQESLENFEGVKDLAIPALSTWNAYRSQGYRAEISPDDMVVIEIQRELIQLKNELLPDCLPMLPVSLGSE